MAPPLLILTDFFQAATGALNYATNLAPPLGARLVLLHLRRARAGAAGPGIAPGNEMN